jgi:ATP-dependent protease ClpP protease subunit
MKTNNKTGLKKSNKPLRLKSTQNKTGQESLDNERAVFVTGAICDEIVIDLTPKILALTQDTEKPITVFIDSYGGMGFHGCVVRRAKQRRESAHARRCVVVGAD